MGVGADLGLGVAGVGPVGRPEHALGGGADQGLGERTDASSAGGALGDLRCLRVHEDVALRPGLRLRTLASMRPCDNARMRSRHRCDGS